MKGLNDERCASAEVLVNERRQSFHVPRVAESQTHTFTPGIILLFSVTVKLERFPLND